MKKDSCCISAVHASNSPDVSVTFSGAPLDLMACMIFIMQSCKVKPVMYLIFWVSVIDRCFRPFKFLASQVTKKKP